MWLNIINFIIRSKNKKFIRIAGDSTEKWNTLINILKKIIKIVTHKLKRIKIIIQPINLNQNNTYHNDIFFLFFIFHVDIQILTKIGESREGNRLILG